CIGGDRYKSKTFSYDSVMNIVYGNNVTASSSTPQDLLLDIYLPASDTFSKRPVIFFTHGGSFLFGTKADGDVVKLCKEFAQRGYVCVSQDYRLGIENFDAIGAARAVWRAMQDGRAAVRYMKANATTYKIDTNIIIYGGSSAGAFTALHVAFLDQSNEVLSTVDTSVYTGSGSMGLGNFKGTTNTLPNTSNVHAVVNLCGAIGDTSWIQAKDKNIPIISMHGPADRTVPYGTAVIKLLNTIPLLKVDGSASIRTKLNLANHTNYFHTYCGQDHVPYAGTADWQRAWMDTTINFIAKNLYENVLKCGSSGIYSNQVDSADCPATGINSELISAVNIYPNPANEIVNIESNEKIISIEIYDVQGKLVFNSYVNDFNFTLNVQEFISNIYLVKIKTDLNIYQEKLLIK
ncbi:MAG: T9SS type A sorting domain-containing protein, partial [bacterium]